MVLKLHYVLELCGELDKIQTTGLTSLSNSVGLGWHLRMCTSYQFPGDMDAAGLGTILGEPLENFNCGGELSRGSFCLLRVGNN